MNKPLKFSALIAAAFTLSIINGCGDSNPKNESSEQVIKTDSISQGPEIAVEEPTVAEVKPNATPEESKIVEKKPETNPPKASSTVKKIEPKSASDADIAEGKALLTKSDCMACHKIDVKVVGPAYVDVAKKYSANEGNYDRLVKKVIDGGSGVWGEVPMSPHPALPKSDAKKMVKYILSLK